MHRLFYSGLVFFHVSAALYTWTAFRISVAAVTTVLVTIALVWLYFDFDSLAGRLRLPSETHGGGTHDPSTRLSNHLCTPSLHTASSLS